LSPVIPIQFRPLSFNKLPSQFLSLHSKFTNQKQQELNIIAAATTPNTFSSSSSSIKPAGRSWFSTFRSMLPILCSAFTAAAIMYPLDLVRALQMANAGSGCTTSELLSNFQRAHGWKGFFTQGLVPELARSTWMRFIKFALFPLVHISLTGKPESKGNELTKALSAIISSIPEALSIMPLEASKIALQLDTANIYKNNMFKAMSGIISQHGWSGLMIGYLGIQYRQAAWSAGYFASIKFFERQVNQIIGLNTAFCLKYPKATKTISQLLSGFFAGVFGACFNTPGDTIRSNLQKRAFQGVKGLTFWNVGKDIIASKGPGALYAGFKFKAFHLGGGGALMAFLIPFFTNIFSEKGPTVTIPVMPSTITSGFSSASPPSTKGSATISVGPIPPSSSTASSSGFFSSSSSSSVASASNNLNPSVAATVKSRPKIQDIP
jgi:hypothetical protein